MAQPIPLHVQGVISQFDAVFSHLQAYPDRAIILELSKMAEIHVDSAYFLVNLIVARVIDPKTIVSWKLPMFYLIDSIMKNVGGPYAALFGKHIAEAYIRTIDEMSIPEKEKLIKLLVTWEERQLLLPEILMKMRNHVNVNVRPSIAAMTHRNVPHTHMGQHAHPMPHQMPAMIGSSHMPMQGHPHDPAAMISGYAQPPPAPYPHSFPPSSSSSVPLSVPPTSSSSSIPPVPPPNVPRISPLHTTCRHGTSSHPSFRRPISTSTTTTSTIKCRQRSKEKKSI